MYLVFYIYDSNTSGTIFSWTDIISFSPCFIFGFLKQLRQHDIYDFMGWGSRLEWWIFLIMWIIYIWWMKMAPILWFNATWHISFYLFFEKIIEIWQTVSEELFIFSLQGKKIKTSNHIRSNNEIERKCVCEFPHLSFLSSSRLWVDSSCPNIVVREISQWKGPDRRQASRMQGT